MLKIQKAIIRKDLTCVAKGTPAEQVAPRLAAGCFTTLASAGFLMALITGCEFDNEICGPDGAGVKISPSSVFLEADETNIIEFTASGGQYGYAWHMNSNTLGTLYFATTNTAVALYQNTTNIGTNILTVRDAGNNEATARIVQR